MIAIIWLWCTLLIAGFYPLIDGRDQILTVFRALGQGKQRKTLPESSGASSVEGVQVDPEKSKA